MPAAAQVNTDRVMRVGQTALYYEDYMVAIQYFNRVIEAKPYLAQPYFFRAVAKINLEDYRGAEEDATLAIERNPFIADAYEVRGVARQNLDNYPGAIEDYDAELKMLPENRSILFNKALAQEAMKDYDGASASFDRLLTAHPGFDNGYVGRARLNLSLGDTVAALADLDKAIDINRNLSNAYTMRAGIAIERDSDFERALTDISEAIRLQPKYAGLYINRAFLRYKLDDYNGAMSDYDYAISLDPLNPVSYYNRGLLLSEVADNDRAISDFTRVLDFDPNDYRALYNRAMLYAETSRYDKALADVNRVIELTPDVAPLYFFRSSIYEHKGDMRHAGADYDKGWELSKRDVARVKAGLDPSESGGTDPTESKSTPEEMVSNLFNTLLTVHNQAEVDADYNNKNIRGKVQDRNVEISVEPMYALSPYHTDDQLHQTARYIDEADMLNATRTLPYNLYVTNVDRPLEDESEIRRQFSIVDTITTRIATGTPRPVDYFARGMSHTALRDYNRAISDFTEAIAMNPDFTLAYLMRAIARHRAMAEPSEQPGAGTQTDARAILSDIDRVIELSPRMAIAYYNKGNLMIENNDLPTALAMYDKAIELSPDLGEAYYNRAYIYFRMGNKDAGIANLSRAGELGVVPSYNFIKRMNR